MLKEIETKILNINREKVEKILKDLRAKQTFNGLLVVDWFRPFGIKEDEDPWFLRVRQREGERPEVTWKPLTGSEEESRKLKLKDRRDFNNNFDISRNLSEITTRVDDVKSMNKLFEAIGLENYAHQEKKRSSWRYKAWNFDIDEYPNMPSFIEIEGKNNNHVIEAMKLLSIFKKYKTWNAGERKLIQQIYNLDWYQMKFK